MRFEITQKITDQIVNKSPENICLVFSYRPSIGSPIANIKVNYPMYLPFYCWRWGAKGLLGPLPSFVSFARHPTAGDNLLYIMTNTNVNCKKSKLTVTYQTMEWKGERSPLLSAHAGQKQKLWRYQIKENRSLTRGDEWFQLIMN